MSGWRHGGFQISTTSSQKFQGNADFHRWHELHVRFGSNRKEWEKKFRNFLSRQPRTTTELEAIIRLGTMDVDPVLNMILCCTGLTTLS